MVNVIMLGALVKITKIPSIESLERVIEDEFEGKVAELNVKAVRIAYEQVSESYVIA